MTRSVPVKAGCPFCGNPNTCCEHFVQVEYHDSGPIMAMYELTRDEPDPVK